MRYRSPARQQHADTREDVTLWSVEDPPHLLAAPEAEGRSSAAHTTGWTTGSISQGRRQFRVRMSVSVSLAVLSLALGVAVGYVRPLPFFKDAASAATSDRGGGRVEEEGPSRPSPRAEGSTVEKSVAENPDGDSASGGRAP